MENTTHVKYYISNDEIKSEIENQIKHFELYPDIVEAQRKCVIYKSILQTLERLKHLENENNSYKNIIDSDIKDLQELRKENQELKKALKGIDTKNSFLIKDKYKLKNYRYFERLFNVKTRTKVN